MSSRIALSITGGLLAALLGGCGYSTGFELPATGIRTVAVKVAGNNTYRQRLEIPLTADIQRALPIYAGLYLASFEEADAILTVEIVDIQGRSLIQGSSQDPVREGALDYSVHVTLHNRRTGEVLRERQVFDRAEFRSPIGETEETAVAEASADLARKIALALDADF